LKKTLKKFENLMCLTINPNLSENLIQSKTLKNLTNDLLEIENMLVLLEEDQLFKVLWFHKHKCSIFH